ncbi:MAG: fused response regulator/phosphatase [Spirochaetales bacterium]|nr:fused response regulator/phosphatase [Spirochaetales bacterium]
MEEKRYLLMIDDDESVLNALYRSLHKWVKIQGLEILKSSTARKTIDILHEKGPRIAVVLADQKMPDIKGSELSRVIAQKYPDTALIILSGNTDLEEMKDIVKSHVQSFISKPWETEDLKSEILQGLTLYELKRELRLNRLREEQELLMGGEFQKSLLKVTLPEDNRISFKVTVEPFSETGLGGDYYDIIPLDDSRLVILTGDVAGHGLKTSFLTAFLKIIIYPEYIKDYKTDPFSPALFTEWLNRRVCEFLKNFPEMFIAFSTALIDFSSSTLTLTNGGQPPVHLLREGESTCLDQNQLVLGCDPDFVYEEQKVPLEGGDGLVFISDGIYPSGMEESSYTPEDFNRILLNNRKRLNNHTALLDEIRETVAPHKIEDDLTLLTVQLN